MSSATLSATAALAGSEVRVLLRNKLLAGTALALPVLLGLALIELADTLGDGQWGVMAGLQLLVILMLAVYATGTTALAARRRELVLKRLRSGELPDLAIVVGELTPVALLALIQTGLLTAVLMIFGAPVPEQPLLFAVAAVGGILFSAAAAVATTRFTASAEIAQLTTSPIFVGALGGAMWVLSRPPEEVTVGMLLIPGAAIADLARIAWDGAGDPLVPALMTFAWFAAAADLARRWMRWAPRS